MTMELSVEVGVSGFGIKHWLRRLFPANHTQSAGSNKRTKRCILGRAVTFELVHNRLSRLEVSAPLANFPADKYLRSICVVLRVVYQNSG